MRCAEKSAPTDALAIHILLQCIWDDLGDKVSGYLPAGIRLPQRPNRPTIVPRLSAWPLAASQAAFGRRR